MSSTVPGINSGRQRDIALVGAYKPSLCKPRKTFGNPRRRRSQPSLRLSLTATLSPSLPPLSPALSTPPHPSVYHAVPEHTMMCECMLLGATMSLLTLLLTSRFLLSFFPNLEKMAKQQNGPIAFRCLIMLDYFLDPIMNSCFKDVESDAPNYAAMIYLASLCAVMQLLVGQHGILFDLIPDTQLLQLLQHILIQQQTILLPQWAMAVFRAYKLI